jgi:hypothetical protein
MVLMLLTALVLRTVPLLLGVLLLGSPGPTYDKHKGLLEVSPQIVKL